MSTNTTAEQLALTESDEFMVGGEYPDGGPDFHGVVDRGDMPPRPINWYLLTADEAEFEWYDLWKWVRALKNSYGLPPTVIPPYWHRHDELVWELSALHTHWLNSYDPDASPSAPQAWHRDFADVRNRLREWVSTSGTKLDRDRPTRITTWPGEEPDEPNVEVLIEDAEADFHLFVLEDVAARRRIEERARGVARAS